MDCSSVYRSFSHGRTMVRVSEPYHTISCRASSLNMGKKINFYKVLSLDSETIGADEIKKAYRTMARRCHPDVCPQSMKEESTRLFVELHRAYETLSNPTLRRMHDLELSKRENQVAWLGTGRLEYSRERWEAQLSGLRRRSEMKERKMARTQREDDF